MATTQEALQISTIVPMFTVDDLQKSITFYEALGFAVDERWKTAGNCSEGSAVANAIAAARQSSPCHGIQHAAPATQVHGAISGESGTMRSSGARGRA